MNTSWSRLHYILCIVYFLSVPAFVVSITFFFFFFFWGSKEVLFEKFQIITNATEHLRDAHSVLFMRKTVDFQSDITEMCITMDSLLTYQQGLVFFSSCRDHREIRPWGRKRAQLLFSTSGFKCVKLYCLAWILSNSRCLAMVKCNWCYLIINQIVVSKPKKGGLWVCVFLSHYLCVTVELIDSSKRDLSYHFMHRFNMTSPHIPTGLAVRLNNIHLTYLTKSLLITTSISWCFFCPFHSSTLLHTTWRGISPDMLNKHNFPRNSKD